MADEKIQQVPASARSVVFERFGPPNEILQIKTLDVPVPAEGQVLIRMRAASINPIDWKISAGMFKSWPISFPRVVGWDGAGVVAKVGPGVQTLKPGDEVLFDNGGGGTFAEYAIAKAIQCAIKPKRLSWEEAAGVPVVFMTAYQCLKVHPVKPGTRVLVLGGTSSVGLAGIQLAKHYGAWTATTCSAAKADIVRALGVDLTIDYLTQQFADVLKDAPVDIVFDTIGAVGSFEKALPIIKKGGLFVCIANHGEKSTPDVTFQGVYCNNDAGSADLAVMAPLFEQSKLIVKIDKVYDFQLNQVIDMFNYSISQRATGKLILRIN